MWLLTLTALFAATGFAVFDDEPCLMRMVKNGVEVIIQIFVDDIK